MKACETARGQSFWSLGYLKLGENLAHLVGLIMQRVCGHASAAGADQWAPLRLGGTRLVWPLWRGLSAVCRAA